MEEEYRDSVGGDSGDTGESSANKFRTSILSFGKRKPASNGRSGSGSRPAPRRSRIDNEEETQEPLQVLSSVNTAVNTGTAKRGRKSGKLSEGQQAGAGGIVLISAIAATYTNPIWQLQQQEAEPIAVAATPLFARLPIPEGQGNVWVEIAGLLLAVSVPVTMRLIAIKKMEKQQAQQAELQAQQNANQKGPNQPHQWDATPSDSVLSPDMLLRTNGIGQEYAGTGIT